MWQQAQTFRGIDCWEHASRPLVLVPHIESQNPLRVDDRRWMLVFIEGDDAEPLTRAIYTLAGAKLLADTVQGESLTEIRSDLNRAVKALQPEHLAAWVENWERKQRSGVGGSGRYADGRFRSFGARGA